jgi:hypothetical protein
VASNIVIAQIPGIIMQQYLEAIKDIAGSCFIAIRRLSVFIKITVIGNIRTVVTNLPLFK